MKSRLQNEPSLACFKAEPSAFKSTLVYRFARARWRFDSLPNAWLGLTECQTRLDSVLVGISSGPTVAVDPRYFDSLNRDEMKAAFAVALSNLLPDLPATFSPPQGSAGNDRGCWELYVFYCQQEETAEQFMKFVPEPKQNLAIVLDIIKAT